MIRSILKALFVGWVAKKFLERDKEPGQAPAPHQPRRA